jgi:hypothetical protein
MQAPRGGRELPQRPSSGPPGPRSALRPLRAGGSRSRGVLAADRATSTQHSGLCPGGSRPPRAGTATCPLRASVPAQRPSTPGARRSATVPETPASPPTRCAASWPRQQNTAARAAAWCPGPVSGRRGGWRSPLDHPDLTLGDAGPAARARRNVAPLGDDRRGERPVILVGEHRRDVHQGDPGCGQDRGLVLASPGDAPRRGRGRIAGPMFPRRRRGRDRGVLGFHEAPRR